RALLGEQGESPAVDVETGTRTRVPVPSVGVEWRLPFARAWRREIAAGWFEARFATVSPLVLNGHVGVEYLFLDNFGVWADFAVSRLNADVRRADYDGVLNIHEGGVRAGATWRF